MAGRAAIFDGTHVAGCARCQRRLAELRAIVTALAAAPAKVPPLPAKVPPLPAKVPPLPAGHLRSVAAPPPSRARRSAWPPRGRALGWASLAAAAALMLALPTARRWRTNDGFVARGGATPAAAWLGLRLYAVSSDGTVARLGDGGRLRRGDGLLVAYDNAGPAPQPYLMVAAVDEERRVYWLYPALAHDDAEGQSIPVRGGAAVELPDQIHHQLSPGPLRVVALFSSRPLRVHEVEGALRRPPPSAVDGATARTLVVHVVD